MIKRSKLIYKSIEIMEFYYQYLMTTYSNEKANKNGTKTKQLENDWSKLERGMGNQGRINETKNCD